MAGFTRPGTDVNSVVHNHSESVIPFGVSVKTQIKPIFHMGSSIGHEVPVWDIHDHFGDTVAFSLRISRWGAILRS